MNQLTINTKQKGAALIVSLVILVAMTLLGITSMKGTSTEVAMAGNLRESALSFQAAEAGLRSAEDVIRKSTSAALLAASSTSGYMGENDADPDYLDPDSWSNATAVANTVSLAGISTNPKFFIKFMGEWSNNPHAKPNVGGGYVDKPPGEYSSNYRVTSRGSGQSSRSFRTVQSYYGIQY